MSCIARYLPRQTLGLLLRLLLRQPLQRPSSCDTRTTPVLSAESTDYQFSKLLRLHEQLHACTKAKPRTPVCELQVKVNGSLHSCATSTS